MSAPNPPNETTITKPAGTVHFTLQGKGGVGKSFVSSITFQYLRTKGRRVKAVDTDLVNHTLAQYQQLDVQSLQLLRDGTIDTRVFDTLMEQILTEDSDYLIDNGASTFVPLWHYLIDNQVLPLLEAKQRKVFIHTVLTGGQALEDTLTGFKTLADTIEGQNLVVWLNEFFGPVENDQHRHFLESPLYEQTKEKIAGIVAIPKRNADTFGRDIQDMLSNKLTFQEAINNGHFSIMAKQRLAQVRKELWAQLENINFA